jgi:hypothetical protein
MSQESRSGIEVTGSVFTGASRPGDFAWMIEQPEYADTLFVFNDNEEQFRAFLAGDPSGCAPGGGNAVIRPWRCHDPPRAAGIPTGVAGAGYDALSDDVRRTIDLAIDHIASLLVSGRYTRVLYSAADSGGDLGTGIFSVAPEVRRCIVDRLEALRRP